MRRTLALHKETLTELGPAELRGVVGGSMLPCLFWDVVEKTKPGVGPLPSVDVTCG